MAVTVRTKAMSGASGFDETTYDRAEYFEVDSNGVLLLLDGPRNTSSPVAAFPSGQWLSVEAKG